MPRALLALAAVLALIAGMGSVAAVSVVRGAQAAEAPPPEQSGGRGVLRKRETPLPLPTVTIAAVGDMALAAMPDGAASLFAGVRPQLATADLALGNLEGTLTEETASKCGSRGAADACYAFRAPPAYAARLRAAGFDVLNLANNHSNDFGWQGLADTIGALRTARLGYTGLPGQITVRRAGEVEVAFVGFAPYPWAESLLDLDTAKRLVRKASRRADLVVVTMHAGAEGSDRTSVRAGSETYHGENRGDVVAFSRAVVDAGADLVVGHGPHVLRGLEWYRGRLIAYSLGNFAAYQTLDVSGVLGVSAILRATLYRDGTWAEGRVVPVRLVGAGTPTIDRGRAALAHVRQLSRADFARRAAGIDRTGRLIPPR